MTILPSWCHICREQTHECICYSGAVVMCDMNLKTGKYEPRVYGVAVEVVNRTPSLGLLSDDLCNSDDGCAD